MACVVLQKNDKVFEFLYLGIVVLVLYIVPTRDRTVT